jgi:hypothetical protein
MRKYKANGRLSIEIANTGALDNIGKAVKSAIGAENGKPERVCLHHEIAI